MEQVIDARLEQDKELIKQVTQRELKRAALRNRIAAMRNCRERINQDNQAVDKDGVPIKGQRKFQEFYVTQQQVTRQVLRRLNFPKEELAQIEAEEELEAANREKKTINLSAEPAEPNPEPETSDKTPDEDDDRCINVGEEDDDEIETKVAKPANPYAFQRLVTVKRPPVAAPAPVKVDPVSRELAELNKQQKAKERQAMEKAQRIAAAKARKKKPN